jgi:hypothetical protein
MERMNHLIGKLFNVWHLEFEHQLQYIILQIKI